MQISIPIKDGVVVTEGGKPRVLPPGIPFSDGVAVVSDDGETRVELLADELVTADSADWPPSSCCYAFEIEHLVSGHGVRDIAPAGQTAARDAIANDKTGDHKRNEWDDIVRRAGIGIDPGAYSSKGKLLTAAKGALP